MKILLLGRTGLLGSEFVKADPTRRFIFDYPRFDLALTDSIQRQLAEADPELIINCAALSNVDACEKSPGLARKINVDAVREIGAFCKANDVPLVHFSTDYVYDGMFDRPYREADGTRPSGVYGKSKLEGEKVIPEGTPAWILRVSTLYGMGRRCHIHWLMEAMKEGAAIPSIASDMLGTPSYTKDIVQMTKDFIERDPEFGVYNFVPHGHCSRTEFARTFFEAVRPGERPLYHDAHIRDLNLLAPRPGNPLLCNNKLVRTGIHIPTWEEGLEDFIETEMVGAAV